MFYFVKLAATPPQPPPGPGSTRLRRNGTPLPIAREHQVIVSLSIFRRNENISILIKPMGPFHPKVQLIEAHLRA